MLILLFSCSEPEAEGPVYYGQVDAILSEHCTRCHSTNNQARSFENPVDVQALAPTIAAYVSAMQMPPPVPDPACRDYEGSEHLTLDGGERAVLEAWANQGAPLGEPENASAAIKNTSIAPFDLELKAAAAYSPDFSEDGENDFRCFTLPMNNPSDLYLTGLEALIDNLAIVHHVVLFDASRGWISEDPSGFACDGFGESSWEFLAGWAPGGGPLDFGPDAGIKLGANTTLVLQMHYYNSFEGADAEQDQSGYGLKVAETVSKEVYSYPLGSYEFTIPAGHPAYTSATLLPWQDRWGVAVVLGVFPHMHLLGSAFEMKVVKGATGESECLIDMNRWNFHNQISALYKEPVQIEGGDAIYLSCTWDNSSGNPNQTSSPPVDVYYGEGTSEEMCFGFSYLYFEE
jgi:hypothetical protein